MKQYTITKAYQSLMRLSYMALPIKTAYAVYMMMRNLEPAYECGVKIEQDLMNKFEIKVEQGRLIPKDQESLRKYLESMKELNNSDVDIEVSPIQVAFSDLEEQWMMASDMKYLEGFVSFI